MSFPVILAIANHSNRKGAEMLSTLDSTHAQSTESRRNVMLNFIDTKGKYRTRNYDVFDKAHREKILKTIEWALIHKIEIRVRSI